MRWSIFLIVPEIKKYLMFHMLLELTKLWNTVKSLRSSNLFVFFYMYFFLLGWHWVNREISLHNQITLLNSIHNCSHTIIFSNERENILLFYLKLQICSHKVLYSPFNRENSGVSVICRRSWHYFNGLRCHWNAKICKFNKAISSKM